MTHFDFLRDAPPAFVERLRPTRIPIDMRTPLAALATTIVIVAAWFGVETMQLQQAQQECAEQRSRAIASRADVAQTKVRRTKLDGLIALDQRVREIRRSGAVLGHHFADIANHVPKDAWLTSIARIDSGMEIQGDAIGLEGLSIALADLFSSSVAISPALVRAGRDDREVGRNVLSFQIHAAERAP
jgi:Tfp pilus assembly protein PilN